MTETMEEDGVRFVGSREIAADPAKVWAGILDAEVLKACLPGCESMTGTPETGYDAVVVRGIGPLKARFTGGVRVLEREELRRLRIEGAGSGGMAGGATGQAEVLFEAVEGGTRLSWIVTADLSGPVARFKGPIVEAFAGKMADGFFARFAAVVEGREPEPQEPPKKGWLRRLID